MQRVAVFDLDGTLNQTKLYAVKANQLALAELGVTHFTDEEILAQFGNRPQDYVKLFLPERGPEVWQQFLRRAAAYEDQEIRKSGKPFDGVEDSLRRLKAQGITVAVCSNASLRYISMVLEVLGLQKYVDEIQPLLPDMTKKETLGLLLERLNPDKAVMAGDRIYDWEAAKTNGIPFVGCLYGYGPQEVQGADATVTHAGELASVMEAILRE